MTTFHARPGQVACGYPIGILCAEWHIPFIPGDLNNASTFDFPVRYLSVPGVQGAAVLAGSDSSFGGRLVEGARQLEREGVRAITGNCGYMASYQQAVAGSVGVPVFMSSLLQAPMLAGLLGESRKLGVLVASGSSVTGQLLAAAGILDSSRIVFEGLDQHEHWNEVILQETGVLDDDRIRAVNLAFMILLRVDDIEKGVGVFRSGLGVKQSLPGVLKILGANFLAIAPEHVVAQMEDDFFSAV